GRVTVRGAPLLVEQPQLVGEHDEQVLARVLTERRVERREGGGPRHGQLVGGLGDVDPDPEDDGVAHDLPEDARDLAVRTPPADVRRAAYADDDVVGPLRGGDEAERPDRADRRERPEQAHPAERRRRHTWPQQDRKSTRLNSSHVKISYAVFCL